ncbi:MAG TPA: head GIN domain-containing protein [Puia sp.]|nr:head GIN domain-containing protein [Puia sp.]
MKNTLLFASLTLVCLASQAQSEDRITKAINDPHAQKRSAQGYHGIHISSGIDLYLSQGDEEAVAVSAEDPEVRDRIRTEVRDGVLNIYMEDRGLHWGNWHNHHAKAYVSCKLIDQLHASGGSDVYVQDLLHSGRLRMDMSGGSDFHGKVNVGELAIQQSGGSDAYFSGSATTLSVHTSGGSDFHGYDLAADECHVDASGGSDAYITVNKELTASASGGSDIHYKGNGVVRSSHASGAGSVSRKD